VTTAAKTGVGTSAGNPDDPPSCQVPVSTEHPCAAPARGAALQELSLPEHTDDTTTPSVSPHQAIPAASPRLVGSPRQTPHNTGRLLQRLASSAQFAAQSALALAFGRQLSTTTSSVATTGQPIHTVSSTATNPSTSSASAPSTVPGQLPPAAAVYSASTSTSTAQRMSHGTQDGPSAGESEADHADRVLLSYVYPAKGQGTFSCCTDPYCNPDMTEEHPAR
jgi:hypothetical protein